MKLEQSSFVEAALKSLPRVVRDREPLTCEPTLPRTQSCGVCCDDEVVEVTQDVSISACRRSEKRFRVCGLSSNDHLISLLTRTAVKRPVPQMPKSAITT